MALRTRPNSSVDPNLDDMLGVRERDPGRRSRLKRSEDLTPIVRGSEKDRINHCRIVCAGDLFEIFSQFTCEGSLSDIHSGSGGSPYVFHLAFTLSSIS